MDHFEALRRYCERDVELEAAFQRVGGYFDRLDPWERIYALHLARTTKASLQQAAATVLFEKLVATDFCGIEKRVMGLIAAEVDVRKLNLTDEPYLNFAKGGYAGKSVVGRVLGDYTSESFIPKGWSKGRAVAGDVELHFQEPDGSYKQIDVQINSVEPIHGDPGPESKAYRSWAEGTFTGRISSGRLIDYMTQMRRSGLPERED